MNEKESEPSSLLTNSSSILRRHKYYNPSAQKTASSVRELTDNLIKRHNSEVEIILARLKRKSLKKKISRFREPPKVRVVDIEDPVETSHWNNHMAELAWSGGLWTKRRHKKQRR
jgi:hypothetical protein